LRDEAGIAIAAGVALGDQIVVGPASVLAKLHPGSSVNVRPK
jgi:hypothetical protein